MINVYPSKMPGEPAEVHEINEPVFVEQWIIDNNPDYIPVSELEDSELDGPLISIEVNGELIEPRLWSVTVIDSNDRVDIRREGKDPGTIAYVVVAIISTIATYALQPDIPSVGRNNQGRGDALALANAEGNNIKLGDVIPQQSGRVRFYPDLIGQPRRWFSGRKEQSLSLLLCYGVGEFDVESRQIEKTDFGNLNIEFQEFAPGENVTGHVAHENWYTVREVGGTTGSSGIKLLSNRDVADTWNGTLTFDGYTVTAADGSIPTDWGPGVRFEVELPIPVTVSDASGAYNTFTGSFDHLMPSVGAELVFYEQGSTDPNRHRIAAYTPGSNGNPDQMQLERREEGVWEPVNNFPNGGTTFFIQRVDSNLQLASMLVTDVTEGSVTVEMWLDGLRVGDWPGYPNVTTSQAVISLEEGEFTEGLWSNTIVATPPNVTTDRIEFDIFASAGLVEVTGTEGDDLEEVTRTIEMRWREAGSNDAWQVTSRTLTGKSRDQLGWSFQQWLGGQMRPEMQVRRVEPESNRTDVFDTLEWFGAKSKLPANTSYPGVTVLAMTLVGSNEIASRTENRVNVLATRRLPEIDDYNTLSSTRSIARFVNYIAKNAGYDDEQLDVDEIKRLGGIWNTRGDYYDYRVEEETTVKVSLNKTLRAGFAQMSSTNGVLVPVRDEAKSEFTQMYTPQNMLKMPQRKYTPKLPGSTDGVNVRYVDGDTWTEEVVECRLPGDAGLYPEEMTLDGVIDRTRAWRIGMRRRRVIEYRRWDYSFETEMDAFNSGFGDYISMGDDIPTFGKSSLVMSATAQGSNALLTLSEPMEFQPGQDHVIAWRRPDGTLSGPYPAQPGPTSRQVLAVGSPVPNIRPRGEPPHAQFGTSAKWTFPTIVSTIDPDGLHRVKVRGSNYDARVYADDDNFPPE